MTEELLYSCWLSLLQNAPLLYTTCGQKITIITPGNLNKDQGPDFFGARIIIGEITWVGSVEVHLRTSDWNRHKHQEDSNYKNVILHVVWVHDSNLFSNFPVLELKTYFKEYPATFIDLHTDQNIRFLQKAQRIFSTREPFFKWAIPYGMSRIFRKAQVLIEYSKKYNLKLDDLCWISLSRSFGYRVNADAFESMAIQTPYYVIKHLRLSITALESLFYGQAHLIGYKIKDAYPIDLLSNYIRLKKTFGLLNSSVPFYFLRMRPANFPTIRISQLSSFLHQCYSPSELFLHEKDLLKMKKALWVKASEYWNNHYIFDQDSGITVKYTGENFIDRIIINTVVPLLLVNTMLNKNNDYKERAFSFLHSLKPEQNPIIFKAIEKGYAPGNAFESQSILELLRLHKEGQLKSTVSWISG